MAHIVPTEVLNLRSLQEFEPGAFDILEAATSLVREDEQSVRGLFFPVLQHAEGFFVHGDMSRIVCFAGGAGDCDRLRF